MKKVIFTLVAFAILVVSFTSCNWFNKEENIQETEEIETVTDTVDIKDSTVYWVDSLVSVETVEYCQDTVTE